jgi:hypothetical protein
MTTNNQRIEKNVELINTGITEAVSERQELSAEVLNVVVGWPIIESANRCTAPTEVQETDPEKWCVQ